MEENMAAAVDILGEDLATHEMRVAAAQLVLDTLRRLGCEELIPYLEINWNKTFTSRMGDAEYVGSLRDRNEAFYDQVAAKHTLHGDGNYLVLIRFSSILWPRASEEDRRQTVIHEVCHIVCRHEALVARRGIPEPHGPEWKAVMRRAGVEPKRCHNVDTVGLKRSRKVVPGHCNCGLPHPLTVKVAERILHGTAWYTCKRCHSRITIPCWDPLRARENIEVAKRILSEGRLF